jgi:hypothetical protein
MVFDGDTSKEFHESPNKSCWWKVIGKISSEGHC